MLLSLVFCVKSQLWRLLGLLRGSLGDILAGTVEGQIQCFCCFFSEVCQAIPTPTVLACCLQVKLWSVALCVGLGKPCAIANGPPHLKGSQLQSVSIFSDHLAEGVKSPGLHAVSPVRFNGYCETSNQLLAFYYLSLGVCV